jgi:hypothetical protein
LGIISLVSFLSTGSAGSTIARSSSSHGSAIWSRRRLGHSCAAAFRSDGCVFINRTDIHRRQPYEYLSYQFGNMSKDSADPFVQACDQLGVMTRVNRNRKGLWDVRINHRAGVESMLAHVGLKS